MNKLKLFLIVFIFAALNISIHAQARLLINEVLASPASDVNGDGTFNAQNDQFIELLNVSGTNLDISGWTVSNESGVRHTIPASTSLNAGSALIIFGGGSPTGTFGNAAVQVASSPLNFTAAGGVISIKNSSGSLVDILDYGSDANFGQSIARDPDISGSFVKHSLIAGAGGALFSPGKNNSDNTSPFPLTTTLTAALAGALSSDAGNDGAIHRGDKIKYTVTINNTGSRNASGVTLTNTVDANTAYDAASFKSTPIALNDHYMTAYNTSLNSAQTTGVIVNDTDPDGSAGLTVVSYGTSPHPDNTAVPGAAASTDLGGNITVNADGSFLYNPPADQAGTDRFGYTLKDSDNNLESAVAEISIYTISPYSAADNYDVTAGSSLNIADGSTDLLANDRTAVPAAAISSFGGGSAGGTITTNNANSTLNLGSGGSLKVNSNGSFDFTPNTGYNGSFTFSYRATSAGSLSDALVTIGVQQAPAASNDIVASSSSPGDKYHTALNTALTVVDGSNDLLYNDNLGFPAAAITSFGGGSLGGSITANAAGATANAANGSLQLNSDGTFVFTPAAGFSGIFSFSYRITNLLGTSDGSVQLAVGIRPSAVNDTYASTVTGNIRINTASNSNFRVLTNDSGDDIELVSTTLTSTKAAEAGISGNVTLNTATGTFSYNPPPGYEGTDSFTYTIQNGFGTSLATVSLTVNGMVWFIDNSAGSAGDGRLGTPFNTMAAFKSINNGTANNPAAGDNIFVYTGSGNYTGGITLLNNQKLFGSGSSTSLSASTGITLSLDSDAFPSTGGTKPVIVNSGGNGITLGSGNTVKGISLGSCSASAIAGSGIGTLSLSDMSINTSGQAIACSTGTINGTIASITSTGGTNNISLATISGTITFSTLALSGATSTAFLVSGGSASITSSGNISQANNAALISISSHSGGTITFQSGTLTATAGTGLQFSGAIGTYNFSGTNALSGGDAGIDLLSGSNGTFTFSSNTSITNPSGIGINLSASSPTFTYAGTVTKSSTTSYLISIQTMSSGTATFSGQLSATSGSGLLIAGCTGGTSSFTNTTKTFSTSTNTAIQCSSNTGHTINFTGGGLSVTTTSGTGINVLAGGTINITGSTNTISSTTGTALSVVNTNIGLSGLYFRSISSNGGSTNGIVLDNTGSNAGLFVSGTGTAGSGGTIQNKTGTNGSTAGGIGIYLNSTKSPNLAWMQLNDMGNFAIRGTTVNGLIMRSVVVSGSNGDDAATDEAAVAFTDLTGTAAIDRCSFSGGAEDNFRVINTTGTLNRIVIDSSTIGHNSTALGNDGILIESQNSAVMNVTVTKCTFNGARGDMIQTNLLGNSTMDLIFQNNTMPNTHTNIVSGGGGLTFSGGGAGSNINFTYDISSNTISGAVGSALVVSKGSGNGAFSGKIYNNTIGAAGTANSGSSQGSGMYIQLSGGGSHQTNIYSNNIYQYNNYAVYFWIGDALGSAPGDMNIRLYGNTISNPGSFATSGIYLNSGVITGDLYNVCFNASGNTISGTGASYTRHMYLRQRQTTTVKFPGYAGANNDNTAAANFVISNNSFPGSSVTNVVTTNAASGSSYGFIGGAACTVPQ